LNHPEVAEGVNPCSRCSEPFCQDCLVEIRDGWYCASCKVEEVKDIKSGVEQYELPLASKGARFGAWVIDYLILVAVSVVISLVTVFSMMQRPTGQVGTGFLILQILPLIFWLVYEALMIQLFGQTVGKIAVNVRVVNIDGSKITAGQSWIRALVKTVLSIISFIPIFFTRQRTGLHDMAARTRVIKIN
jgi:uncharacterized RDD family membrane protein YckC